MVDLLLLALQLLLPLLYLLLVLISSALELLLLLLGGLDAVVEKGEVVLETAYYLYSFVVIFLDLIELHLQLRIFMLESQDRFHLLHVGYANFCLFIDQFKVAVFQVILHLKLVLKNALQSLIILMQL